MKKIILASALGLAAATSSAAGIVNGSFENDLMAPATWSVLPALDGWVVSGDGVELRNAVAGTAYAGSNFIELDAKVNSWIEQTVSTVAGQAYQLSFFYSPREGVSSASNPVDVLIDGVIANSYTGSVVGWNEYTLSFTGGASGTNTIRFAASGDSDGVGGSLDAVSVTAVPEPSSTAMLLAGLGMMGFIARRRTRG